jgi:hypothetical protein
MLQARTSFVASIFALGLVLLVPGITAQQYDQSLYSGLRWRMIGPFRAGRVKVSGAIAAGHVLFGSVGGGLWKLSTPAAPETPIFDSATAFNRYGTAAPSDANVITSGRAKLTCAIDHSGMYKSLTAEDLKRIGTNHAPNRAHRRRPKNQMCFRGGARSRLWIASDGRAYRSRDVAHRQDSFKNEDLGGMIRISVT